MTELPGDLPVPLECHALTLNTIELQLSYAVADTSMLKCSAQFRILFINAHFEADNASHALASSATVRPTFNVEEKVVVMRSGWTPKEEDMYIYIHIYINTCLVHPNLLFIFSITIECILYNVINVCFFLALYE